MLTNCDKYSDVMGTLTSLLIGLLLIGGIPHVLFFTERIRQEEIRWREMNPPIVLAPAIS
jgi:hypothetical protein